MGAFIKATSSKESQVDKEDLSVRKAGIMRGNSKRSKQKGKESLFTISWDIDMKGVGQVICLMEKVGKTGSKD